MKKNKPMVLNLSFDKNSKPVVKDVKRYTSHTGRKHHDMRR